MRRVILVAGPPCSGKTTYVTQRAKPGDLVLDQDAIGAAAMRQGLAKVAAMTDGTAWVIRCSPGPRRREEFARQIRAEVVLLTAPEPELIARAAHRPNPRRHIQAVRDWLRREALDKPGRAKTGVAHNPRPSAARRGYNWEHRRARAKALKDLQRAGALPCPFCHHDMTVDMSLDYDHAVPLAYDPSGKGPRRLAHSSCNRRAGQAIAQARLRTRKRRTTVSAVNSRRW
jgi:Uncharacterized protein conserved in bacteria